MAQVGNHVRVDHVALGVGRGDGPAAARLLELMGLTVTDNGPSLVGDPWYTAGMDGMADGTTGFFLVPISDAQVELEALARDRLGRSDPAAAFVEARRGKPDSTTHVALTHTSLEGLEAAVRALHEDELLAGRVATEAYRPADSEAWVTGRLDRSPVFSTAAPVRYLRDGVQVFVHTDLVGTGLLTLGQTIEMNHQLTP